MESKEDKIVIRKLKLIILISFIFMILEIFGGTITHSVAILSDAFHLFSDVLAYVISLQAIRYSYLKPPKYMSFGYEKLQPLGALVNITLIYFVMIQLIMIATTRIIYQQVVAEPYYMVLTSFIGLGCNLYIMKVLHTDQGYGNYSHLHSHSISPQCHLSQSSEHSPTTSQFSHYLSHLQLNETFQKHDSYTQNCVTPKRKSKFYKSYPQSLQDQLGHSSSCKSLINQNYGQQLQNIQPNNFRNRKYNPLFIQQKDRKVTVEEQQYQIKISPQKLIIYKNIQDKIRTDQIRTHTLDRNNPPSFKNINLEAAYIHILSDIILSVGVILSALIIYMKADPTQWSYWHLADPICTYIFSLVAIYSTINIIKSSISILLGGCDNSNLITQIQYKINQIYNIQLEQCKVWTSNRSKYYAAIKIQIQLQEISNPDRQIKKAKRKIRKILNENNIKNQYIDIKLKKYVKDQ